MIWRPRCIHEAGHRRRVAQHDDRAALLVDSGAGADVALDDQVAARSAAPANDPALLSTTTTAGHHVSRRPTADTPVISTSGPSIRPQPK